MKKFLIAALFLGCMLTFTDCKKIKSDSKEEVLMEFAEKFGEMAENNNIRGIKDVYPDAGDIKEAYLNFNKDKIEIFPEGDGKYKIKYGGGASIVVRTGLNDAVEVLSTEGILEMNDEKKAEAKKETPKKEVKKKEVVEDDDDDYEPVHRSSLFSDGYNSMSGSFHFQGADYGFIITFNYNSRTGKVSGASYEATGYGGGGSKNKINSMTITNDRSISIKGPGLSIKASGSGNGYFSGSMTRGNHTGTCSLSI